jgi:hypothetical protein
MAYRGKYPHRIHTVGSVKGRQGLMAITNTGFRYMIGPSSEVGRANMPKPGVDISAYIASPHYHVTPLDGDVSNARGQ